MTKHRRMVVSQHGGPNVLHVLEENLPEPRPGEVRVRILAAGVSFADVLMREGIHPEARRGEAIRRSRETRAEDRRRRPPGPGQAGLALLRQGTFWSHRMYDDQLAYRRLVATR